MDQGAMFQVVVSVLWHGASAYVEALFVAWVACFH
jgi:hypothetical protein